MTIPRLWRVMAASLRYMRHRSFAENDSFAMNIFNVMAKSIQSGHGVELGRAESGVLKSLAVVERYTETQLG